MLKFGLTIYIQFTVLQLIVNIMDDSGFGSRLCVPLRPC